MHLAQQRPDDSFEAPPKKFKELQPLTAGPSDPYVLFPDKYKGGLHLMYLLDELKSRTMKDDAFIDILMSPSEPVFDRNVENERPYAGTVPNFLHGLRTGMRNAAARYFERQRDEVDLANDIELAELRASFSEEEKEDLQRTLSNLFSRSQTYAEERVAMIKGATPQPPTATSAPDPSTRPNTDRRKHNPSNRRRSNRGRKAWERSQ